MKKYLPAFAIAAIMILSATLHLWNISSIGDSNAYYTAAVESMTQSWHNFFYAAAEPGGSVSVDKPPLGLMIETISALLFGVSGFSTALPNIITGVLSVPLLYHLVKKHFGSLAGIVAALVLTVTPVVFAADRNNTQDGLLTFFLLLGAWAFIKAVESGRARWLFLGAVIVGLGFNIKMLQAYLVLPAFFALYFFGAKIGWLKKSALLAAATVVLLAVSLSWALYVDSVPADERPYIGSSGDNTVMGLITGHNGTSRLFNARSNNGQTPPSALTAGSASDAPLPSDGNQQSGQAMFSWETGEAGWLRFFTAPLAAEMSWLLPFALFSLVMIAFQARVKLPIAEDAHLGLILWGGWLMTCVVFFSLVSGIFHAYYVIMLAPALGAVVGAGFGVLWQRHVDGQIGSGWWLTLAVAVTVGFQVYVAWAYEVNALFQPLAFALVVIGAALMFVSLFRATLARPAFIVLLTAMLIVPLSWSALTVTLGSNGNLPAAYDVSGGGPGGAPASDDKSAAPAQTPGNRIVNDALLQFLQANTQDVQYLVAVESAQVGSPLVIATGRPVLLMGGFGGGDNVVSVDDLAQMVVNGELRYVLYGGGRGGQQEISNWLRASCKVVPEFSQQGDEPIVGNPQQARPGAENGPQVLYDCR